jgi:predicted amidohydrolase YtcJ
MVQRTNRNGVVVDEQEAVTVGEALRAFTVDAAFATFTETDRGTLTPGKYAVLAVLTRDAFQVPTAELSTVTSALTMVGGRVGPPAD